MQYKPVFGNLLVREVEEDAAIVTAEKNPVVRAEVVEMSYGRYLNNGLQEPLQVRPHTIIHFLRRDGIPLTLGEVAYYVVDQHDILVYEED